MKVIRIPDRFNPCKAWLVNFGQTFYNGFVRVTKKFLAELLGRKELVLCFAEESDISGRKAK